MTSSLSDLIHLLKCIPNSTTMHLVKLSLLTTDLLLSFGFYPLLPRSAYSRPSGVIGYTVRPNFRSGGPYSLREYGPPRTQLPREYGPPDRVPWLYTKPINRTQFPRELSPPPDRIPWFEIYACISIPCMHVTFQIGSKSKSCRSSTMYAVSIRSVTAHLVRKSKATMITGRQL